MDASVDESLFGSERSKSEMFKSSRKVVTGQPTGQSIIISQEELNRVKATAVFKSEIEIMAEIEDAQKLKENKQQEARKRKERMKQLEVIAAQKAKKTEEEIEKQTKDQDIRDAAASKMNGYSDVVKVLSSMSCRAAAFTMREKQLEEKKLREAGEKQYDHRMDLIMEVDRLTELQRREQEEAIKRSKRIADRKVITDQMEQRQRIKLLAAEAREQENIAMRSLMKKYQSEEEQNIAKKKIEIEKSRNDVIKANEEAIRRKQLAKEIEKKELEDILQYQALKDLELAKREEDEAILARVKKERQAAMLAQQERAQNNADKLDEIRARRAAEEKERIARQKDKDDAEKKKAEMTMLLESRCRQAEDKKQREAKLVEQQEREYRATLEHMETISIKEKKQLQKKYEKAVVHKKEILGQIEEGEKKAMGEKVKKTSEGLKLKKSIEQEETKYSSIRDTMVADLANKGVDPRYLSEMRTVDVGKLLRR